MRSFSRGAAVALVETLCSILFTGICASVPFRIVRTLVAVNVREPFSVLTNGTTSGLLNPVNAGLFIEKIMAVACRSNPVPFAVPSGFGYG